RPCVHESLAGDGRHRRRVSPVHIVNFGDITIDYDRVVDVGHLCDIHDTRIGDIDVLHVARAAAVARNVHVTRSEWKPGHACEAAAKGNGEAHAASAHEAHERGCIHRAYDNGTRHPAPHASDEHPTAVMEGSKAPGRIIDPCPAPRRDVHPVTV